MIDLMLGPGPVLHYEIDLETDEVASTDTYL